MKSFFFLLLFTASTAYSAGSQTVRVSVDLHDASVETLFREIEKITDYSFIYNPKQVENLGKSDFLFRDTDLTQVLEKCLSGTALDYTIRNRHVIINVRENMQQPPAGQRVPLSGKARDRQGNPLAGVTVVVKGTNIGTATDASGTFTIRVLPNDVLVLSFVGKKTQEIKYTGQQSVDVIFHDDVFEIETVVVKGVFNRPAESYTGSVVMISKQELQLSGSRNIIQTLSNIDPSFNVIENNEWGSDPNRLPELTVRGNSVLPPDASQLVGDVSRELNTPLILLNGFEITLRQLMDIDVDEIESIQLMKDAVATAQFGSRGANGVLMVITGLPAAGKLRIAYNGGLELEIPDLSSYNLLNARESLDLEYKAGHFNGITPLEDIMYKNFYASLMTDVERGIDTDWLAQPVRVGVGHSHRLSLSGGDQVFRYQMYVSNRLVEGAMKGTKRNAFNTGITLTYNTGNFQFQNMAALSIANSDNSSSYGNFSDYAKQNPYLPIYDDDGRLIKEYPSLNSSRWRKVNPMYNTLLHMVDISRNRSLTNTFSVDWNPIPELTFSGRFGITSNDGTTDVFLPADHTSFANETDATLKGSYTYGTTLDNRWEVSARATYSKLFSDNHMITLGFNAEMSNSNYVNYSFAVYGFPHERLDFLANALAYRPGDRPSGSEAHTRRASFSAIAGYTLMQRYNLDFNFRRDGSSQYGNKNRWQDFYSIGVSWNMNKEEFIKNIQFIDNLKLRASLGLNGFNTIDAYGAVPTFEYYVEEFYNNWIGNHLKQIVNDDLGWGLANKKNIGFDLYMFDNRISLMADFYLHTYIQQITSITLPLSNGFKEYSANAMSTENRGIEIKATVKAINNMAKKTSLSITVAGAHDKDKVLKISDIMQRQLRSIRAQKSITPIDIIEEGKSRNTQFVVPSLGIDPSNGRELLLKKNGDVTYDYSTDDIVAMGSKVPKWRGNLGIGFRYHDLTVNATFRYEWGSMAYNKTLIDRVENASLRYNVDKRVYYDRWSEPGQAAFFKGLNNTEMTLATSRFLQKKAEFRCTSFDVRYDFRSHDFIRKMNIDGLTLSLTVNEPFILSTIKQERGTSYPFARNIKAGLALIF